MYIPSTDPDDNTLPYDRCNYFRYTNESTMNTTASRQKLKCSEWVYSDDIYGNTFAKEVKHLLETIAYTHQDVHNNQKLYVYMHICVRRMYT